MRACLIVMWIGVSPLLAAAETTDKPNILFIAVDDLRNDLGCYGVDAVKSPHIDRLARSGVVFDRAYCQVAVCNPSRASLMTGLRPDTLRVWNLRVHFREMRPDVVTLPQHLRRHGYHAVGMGKVYHNPWPDPQSWSEPIRYPRDLVWYGPEVNQQIRDAQAKMPDSDRRKTDLRGPSTYALDAADERTYDGAIASLALDAMDRLKDRDEPFFLAVGFIRPHLPFVAPKRYFDMYDRDAITTAADPHPPKGAPTVALGTNYEMRHYVDLIDFTPPTDAPIDPATARRLIHGYRACVSYIDAQVGRLIAGLAEHGLAENTVVVLWSDHGWKLGEHNGWSKMTNYELDTRVPLIVYDPRADGNGKRCGSLVELLDMYPTLCDLAGVPAPEHAQGRSFRKLLDDPATSLHDAAFSQYERRDNGVFYMGYAMRTDRYRYVEWRDRTTGKTLATELYDHDRDPHENTNVAADADAELLATLRDRLHESMPPAPIDDKPTIASRPSRQKATLTVVNAADAAVDMHWITPQGIRRKQATIAPGAHNRVNTFVGHVFVAESRDGKLHRVLRVDSNTDRVELRVK